MKSLLILFTGLFLFNTSNLNLLENACCNERLRAIALKIN